MATFAELNTKNEVTRLIKVNNDVVDRKKLLLDLFGEDRKWVQAFYSRKNYPAIGDKWDEESKKFIKRIDETESDEYYE